MPRNALTDSNIGQTAIQNRSTDPEKQRRKNQNRNHHPKLDVFELHAGKSR
jgi:hypothetical protein